MERMWNFQREPIDPDRPRDGGCARFATTACRANRLRCIPTRPTGGSGCRSPRWSTVPVRARTDRHSPLQLQTRSRSLAFPRSSDCLVGRSGPARSISPMIAGFSGVDPRTAANGRALQAAWTSRLSPPTSHPALPGSGQCAGWPVKSVLLALGSVSRSPSPSLFAGPSRVSPPSHQPPPRRHRGSGGKGVKFASAPCRRSGKQRCKPPAPTAQLSARRLSRRRFSRSLGGTRLPSVLSAPSACRSSCRTWGG